MEKLSEKICLRLKPYILPYCAVILLGLAAHAFMLTNKICFAGDAGGLFRKGDTVVSGRFGLALTSYIMPDISMPWLNGLMSLLLIAAAVMLVIVCNIYFSNAMYLFLHLQFEELKSYYTTMITMVMQTEGFEEGVELAIAGEEPALRYRMEENFDFSGFQDPDIDIKNKIHAQGIINSFVGSDIPFASEETIAGIEQTEEFKSMAIYPYNGSVKKIGSCIVVRLGE